MAKTKWRKLHKIKIHKNRWLAWAIAYAVIVVIGVVGYIQVSEVNFETQMAAESQFQPWRSFQNSALGFSIRYPADWSVNALGTTTTAFSNPANSSSSMTVAVLNPSAETQIRKSLKHPQDMRMLLDNQRAVKIQSDSETVILALYKSRLYVLSSSSASLLDKFALTFRFTK